MAYVILSKSGSELSRHTTINATAKAAESMKDYDVKRVVRGGLQDLTVGEFRALVHEMTMIAHRRREKIRSRR